MRTTATRTPPMATTANQLWAIIPGMSPGFVGGITTAVAESPTHSLSESLSKSHSDLTGWRKTKLRIVTAVFEQFTERAIKFIIFSKKEARALGRNMVFTQHLLLSLIAKEELHHMGVAEEDPAFAARR
ncbi:hypothetical protein ACFX15_008370 [Malus domestica]